MMIESDTIPPLARAHFRLDVYDGDIRRAPLPIGQRVWNLYANLRWRIFHRPASHYHHAPILNRLLETMEGDNLVLTLGKQILLDRLFGLSAVGALTHMGVGTDSTAVAVGQNKLNPTVAGSVDFNAFDSTPVRASQTVTCVTTWATGDGNFIWNELGTAKSATNDGTNLFNRIIIGPFTKSAATSIVVTETITQT